MDLADQNEPDVDDVDEALIESLVAYDTALAKGDWSVIDSPAEPFANVNRKKLHELETAKANVLRLERLWPRSRPVDENIPRTIGRFHILKELGRGGFGIVYLALDEQLERQVALKVQRPEALLSSALRERFVREAKTAARLEHPHIAGVYEVGEAAFRIWIASEYVADGSLAAWLRQQKTAVSPTHAARFMASLADALDYAHRQGVLHRDLKPSNVLLLRAETGGSGDDDLSSFVPKLIDFGLAKLEVARNETRSGTLIGTPPYMAPEQAAGNVRAIGPATDVYGLGTILYELLSGQPAFIGHSDAQTLRQVVEDDPIGPRKLCATVPRDLEAICLKCLEKNPAKRYASAVALAVDLRRYLSGEPTLARPLAKMQRLAKWVRRRPALAALVAVSMLALFAIAITTGFYVASLQRAELAAQHSATLALQQEEIASQYLYASRMRLAHELLQTGDAEGVAKLIEPYEADSPSAARRGFEWYYLKRQIHSERLNLTGHRGQLYAVAFSPDGRVLATGGEDKLIKLWDSVSGKELATLAGHGNCVNGLAYSPDGQILASVSCDRTVKLWRPDSHELLATLERHSDEVRCLAFSPDGTRLATAGKERLIWIWDVAARKPVKTLVPGGEVNCIVWRRDDQIVQPGEIWNVKTGEKQLVSERCDHSIAVSQDGLNAVMGTIGGTVRSIPQLSTTTTHLKGRGWEAHALCFLPGRSELAVGYDDGSIQVCGWPDTSFRQVLSGHTARVQCFAVAPAGDQLASASFDATVKVWSLDSESTPRIEFSRSASETPTPLWMNAWAISSDLSHLAVSTRPEKVVVFDVKSGQEVAAIDMPEVACTLGFSSTDPSTVFGFAPASGRVWKWNWPAREAVTIACRSTDGLVGAVLACDARHLITFSANGPPAACDIRAGDRWWALKSVILPASGLGVCFSPDQQTCSVGADNPMAAPKKERHEEVLDLAAKASIYKGKQPIAAIANGGRLIAINPWMERRFAIIEAATGKQVSSIRRSLQIRCVTFSPDARTLCAGDVEGRIYLWNVATGQLMVKLETDGRSADVVRFSADGRSLAALTIDQVKGDDGHFKANWRMYIWSGDVGR